MRDFKQVAWRRSSLGLTHFILIMAPGLFPVFAQAQEGQKKPNIVLVLMDNLGWGEIGCYGGGILRGAPTPRLDKFATEGMRLLNFNVEAQCTPSRACLMTGRYAIRTGCPTVPSKTPIYGLTQWEYTMAEMLSDAGYTTSLIGKWHLGQTPGRFPGDQGYDEWYGIPNSTDECFWPDSDLFRTDAHPFAKYEYVMEGRKGEAPHNVKVYDTKQRTLIDRELTDKTLDFMRRQSKTDKPFFCLVAYTQPHMPVLPSPEFKGKTKNGFFADVLAQTDAYVGDLLDGVDSMGLRDNTIFIFTSDNGGEMRQPWQGFSGPWAGTFFTGMEASLRVAFMIRWPGKVPAGAVNNEIVHEMDLFTTFAHIAGGKVPTDRIIDGVDQTDFFMGKSKSKREAFVVYVGDQIFGVKWRDWKLMTKGLVRGTDPIEEWGHSRVINLLSNPKEEPLLANEEQTFWVRWPAGQVLADHLASLKQEPAIPIGTPDPYTPPAAK